MRQRYPNLPIDYYWCDTGKELDETYRLIGALEAYLGKSITPIRAAKGSHHENPFDHFIEQYGGFLPSSNARWCTKKLKLEPFESYVGNDPVVSYVGIRGDEEREGYISKKTNIQSIFPFRKNIWSLDVVSKVLANDNMSQLESLYAERELGTKLDKIIRVVRTPIDARYKQEFKLEDLIDLGTRDFNYVVYGFLKSTSYPLANEGLFPLLDNEDNLVRDDIFRLLLDSGVGVPAYYEPVNFEQNGQQGQYARSRSGCYFCFFQQKIEWVWLLEQHPELYEKAMAYEREGYQWSQDESLLELCRPERVMEIKAEYLKRAHKKAQAGSGLLVDLFGDAEGEGCTACFV